MVRDFIFKPRFNRLELYGMVVAASVLHSSLVAGLALFLAISVASHIEEGSRDGRR
jgi:hypothetical protein